MKCFFCLRGMATGDSLFRINPKGVKGIWACREHRDQTDTPRDPVLDEIVGIIERKSQIPAEPPTEEPEVLVCETCEGGGWVQVYSPCPPGFDICPSCFNPDENPCP